MTQRGTPITNTYVYDTANRLTSVNGQTYQWDDNGNLLNDGASTYAYDAANRLTSVSNQSSVSSYQYNGLGDRLSQTVDSATTNYVLDLNAGLTQVLADGTNTYLYGNGRIGELQPAGFVYHLGDALGSVRQLTNGSGTVTLARSYEPYGETLSSAGSGNTVFQFTGEARDTSGLTYLRSRYLSTVAGRFFQEDNWAGDFESPLTLNKYLYANANPVLYTDPSGQWCVMGFSTGPGEPCTEAKAQYWAREYQAAAILFQGIGSDPNKRNAFAEGFLTEFIDDISVIQGVTLLNACLDVALDSINGNNSASQQRRTFRQTDPYYLAGRIHGRIFAAEVGIGTGLLGAAGLGGGMTISLSGIGAVVGVPTAALSAVLAVHGTAVIAVVAAKEISAPLPSLANLMATSSSGSKRPVNRDGAPYPKQNVKKYGEVPFPEGNIVDTDPSMMRRQFNDSFKERFRKWWEAAYGWYPDSGTYAIHHIHPLSKGGTNDFENLVPLQYGEAHNQFTRWWLEYP